MTELQLQLKIVEDWKAALKAKDEKKQTLSLIITEMKNRAIKENLGTGDARVVDDKMALEVLQKMAKQRREAIESYQTANRPDLLQKECDELAVIEGYLPKALSDEELAEIIKKIALEVEAKSMADIGRVMAPALKAAGGRADGKRVQKIAQVLLSK